MSNKPKLTRWFDLKATLPVMPGVYEVSTRSLLTRSASLPFPFHKWDGGRWGSPGATPDTSAKELDEGGHLPGDFYLDGAIWRGLKEPA